MTLKNLKHNIEEEKEIVRELIIAISQRELKYGHERELLTRTIDSLSVLLTIINNSIPGLAGNISPVKKLGKEGDEVKDLVNVTYSKDGLSRNLTINENDKKRFFQELNLSDLTLKRLKKTEKAGVVSREFKKPSYYAKISNRFFSKISNRLIEKGHFKNVERDLRKANIVFILNTYVSIMFFTALLVFFFSILLFVFLMFFSFSLEIPFIVPATLSASRILINIAVSLSLPLIAFFMLYAYPMLEAGGIGKKINQELPFVTMNMSAIAGSGIEPTQIFKIIALGKEYPATSKEMKKIINQVNIYGYDLVSALKNTARSTSSNKLAELFNGMATAISTGGSLTEFLDKRTESLLFDYQLERERATKMAETFMDIYISIVIAAPMIMMILLILLSVGPMSIGLTIQQLTLIIISAVALINVVFLAVLHLKQPVY